MIGKGDQEQGVKSPRSKSPVMGVSGLMKDSGKAVPSQSCQESGERRQSAGILRLEPTKPRRRSSVASVELRNQQQDDPSSPCPSDRLSVTWADGEKSVSSEASIILRGKEHLSENPSLVTLLPTSVPVTPSIVSPMSPIPASPPKSYLNEPDLEDDLQESISIIHLRTESVRYTKKKRRRSTRASTSSLETVVNMDSESSDEKVKIYREVISGVKQHPWPIRKKLYLTRVAKDFLAKHEGELEERLAQSTSTRDVLYRYFILFRKFVQLAFTTIYNWITSVELWQGRIKRIESHFGSAVASYFTFLRWVMGLNAVIALMLAAFVIIPETLAGEWGTPDSILRKEMVENETATAHDLKTLLDFEGSVRYSSLFYGFYGKSVKTKEGYRLPLAYILTSMCVYAYSFVAILRKMAANSRLSKLGDDDESVFTFRLFTGWDFTIGNTEAAQNKVASVNMGFRESLLEASHPEKEEKSWKLIARRMLAHFLVICLLVASSYVVVILVKRSQDETSRSSWWRQNELTVVWNFIALIFPYIFNLIGIIENRHPRKHLQWLLARIMVLNLLNLYTLMFALFANVHKLIDKQELEFGIIKNQEIEEEKDSSSLLGNNQILDWDSFKESTVFPLIGFPTIASTLLGLSLKTSNESATPSVASFNESDVEITATETSLKDLKFRIEVDEPVTSRSSSDEPVTSRFSSDAPVTSRSSSDAPPGCVIVTRPCYNDSSPRERNSSSESLSETTLNIDAIPGTKATIAVETKATVTAKPATSERPDFSRISGVFPKIILPFTWLSDFATANDSLAKRSIRDLKDLRKREWTRHRRKRQPANKAEDSSIDSENSIPYPPLKEETTTSSIQINNNSTVNTILYSDNARVDNHSDIDSNFSDSLTQSTRTPNPNSSVFDNLTFNPFLEDDAVINSTQYDKNISDTSTSDTLYPFLNQNETENTEASTSLPTTTNNTLNTDDYSHYEDGSYGKDKNCFIQIQICNDSLENVSAPLNFSEEINETPLPDSALWDEISTTSYQTADTTTTYQTTDSNIPSTTLWDTASQNDSFTTQYFEEIPYPTNISWNATNTSEVSSTRPDLLNATTELIQSTTASLAMRIIELPAENQTSLRKLCWETMFGQEIIKLTVMDLAMTSSVVVIFEYVRAVLVRYLNKWCSCSWDLEKQFPGYPNFDIAGNILHLVNNQGVVWMGMFFSPGLPALNLLKLLILLYVRSWAVVTSNVPPETVFKASNNNNFYLALLLIMLFLCTLPVGYAVVWLKPSDHCGPFSEYPKIYQLATTTLIESLPQAFEQVIDYISSPGTVIPLVLLLVLIIYYLVSLTAALREANEDLKEQLRSERSAEKKKKMEAIKAKSDPTSVANRWTRLAMMAPSIPNKLEKLRLERERDEDKTPLLSDPKDNLISSPLPDDITDPGQSEVFDESLSEPKKQYRDMKPKIDRKKDASTQNEPGDIKKSRQSSLIKDEKRRDSRESSGGGSLPRSPKLKSRNRHSKDGQEETTTKMTQTYKDSPKYREGRRRSSKDHYKDSPKHRDSPKRRESPKRRSSHRQRDADHGDNERRESKASQEIEKITEEYPELAEFYGFKAKDKHRRPHRKGITSPDSTDRDDSPQKQSSKHKRERSILGMSDVYNGGAKSKKREAKKQKKEKEEPTTPATPEMQTIPIIKISKEDSVERSIQQAKLERQAQTADDEPIYQNQVTDELPESAAGTSYTPPVKHSEEERPLSETNIDNAATPPIETSTASCGIRADEEYSSETGPSKDEEPSEATTIVPDIDRDTPVAETEPEDKVQNQELEDSVKVKKDESASSPHYRSRKPPMLKLPAAALVQPEEDNDSQDSINDKEKYLDD